MGRVIDTTVLIALERRRLGLEALRDTIPENEEVAIAAVTVSEILAGIYRASDPVRRRTREVFLDAILDAVAVLPFDLRVARTYGRLWADLAIRGHFPGIHDAQIAATALTHGYDVLTENTSDFERVEGLGVMAPSWPK